LVGVPAGALAQDVAQPAPVAAQPAPVAAEPAPAPAPAPEPVLAPAPAPEAPAATEETEPAPAEEEGAPVTGWFRIDSDIGGLQLWGGATFPLSDTIGLATDIYVGTLPLGGPSFGEFDIGPSITLAPGISILPMVGLAINWSTQKAYAFVPQFYAYVDTSVIYFEFWSQLFLQDMFNEPSQDYLHLRAFPLFKASDSIAIGLEIDANIVLKNAATKPNGDEIPIAWLPIGPHVKMAAGASSTIELFVGYDLADEQLNSDRRFAGRFTFTQTF
jgi:hypothetical protein